jgi:hypothetical protein
MLDKSHRKSRTCEQWRVPRPSGSVRTGPNAHPGVAFGYAIAPGVRKVVSVEQPETTVTPKTKTTPSRLRGSTAARNHPKQSTNQQPGVLRQHALSRRGNSSSAISL